VHPEAPALAKSAVVKTMLSAELDMERDEYLTAKYKAVADANLKKCTD